MSDAYERVTWRGSLFNRRTVAMFAVAEEKSGRTLPTPAQGSYSTSTSASAGTHAGGGAVDFMVAGPTQGEQVERDLRSVGFAAWYRPELPGVWGDHVHAIAIGDAELSSAASSQVGAYRNDRDGLAGNAYDGSWKPSPIPVFDYEQWKQGDDMQLSDDIYPAGDKQKSVGDLFRRLDAFIARQDNRAVALREQVATVRQAVNALPAGATRDQIKSMLNNLDATIQIVVDETVTP